MPRVLAVVAHPDDEVLGCGGTLAWHAGRGDEVHVLIATRDRSGGKAEDVSLYLGTQLPRRLDHAVVSLAKADERDLNRPIERAVAEIRPSVVYTHHLGDLNTDHRAIARAAMVACRPCSDGAPRRLLAFDTPSSTEWSFDVPFSPSVFVDVTTTIDRKIEAMRRCYEAELRPAPHPRSEEAIRARAKYWGQVAGTGYAEAFVLVREIA